MLLLPLLLGCASCDERIAARDAGSGDTARTDAPRRDARADGRQPIDGGPPVDGRQADGSVSGDARPLDGPSARDGAATVDLPAGSDLTAQQLSSISQEGITWHFDKPYSCGQFANKNDWWCVGPLTITQITPDFDGTYNGWEVNPSSANKQSFDKRSPMGAFVAPPALPYEAQPGQSIVKVDSWEQRDADCKSAAKTVGPSGSYSHPVCVWAASVLTVLDAVPPDGGATVFRPPYFGTTKPLYSTTALRLDKLPSLSAASLGDLPTLQWIHGKYKNVFLDHGYRMNGYSLLPMKWTREYGSYLGKDAGDAVLRLMLDDPPAKKLDAVVALVQRGIDIYQMYLAGLSWPGAGGWGNGRKLPLVFAAALLDDPLMIAEVKQAPTRITTSPSGKEQAHPFHEDNMVYRSTVTGIALFGQSWDSASEQKYWHNQATGSGSRDIRDPYGYIDGGQTPGQWYQYCCNSAVWRAPAIAGHLLDELRQIWNHEPFFEYTDRWVTQGAWTLPDPCSAKDPGPAYSGSCVKGGPRYAGLHGANANGGEYSTAFVTKMWATYR